MRSTLTPVGLTYLDEAPVQLSCRFTVAAPRERVFRAVAAEPSGWGRWFPGFSGDGHWVTPPPRGVGSARVVTVVGKPLRETILAWDESKHWAFRVDETDLPAVRALVEDYWFQDDGLDRTCIRWSCGADFVQRRLITSLMRPVVPRLLAHAGRRLAAELRKGSEGDWTSDEL